LSGRSAARSARAGTRGRGLAIARGAIGNVGAGGITAGASIGITACTGSRLQRSTVGAASWSRSLSKQSQRAGSGQQQAGPPVTSIAAQLTIARATIARATSTGTRRRDAAGTTLDG